MKLLILADLHIGNTKESVTHPGIIRQASTSSQKVLREYIPKFNSQKFDYVIQMGDLIRDVEDKMQNVTLLSKVKNILEELNLPIINIPGNHDLKAFVPKDLDLMLNGTDSNFRLYGCHIAEDFQFIWLDFQKDENGMAYLPQERMDWLNELVDNKRKTIIFSHYSLIPQNAKDNFYFEHQPKKIAYLNTNKILKSIKNSNVKLALSAHCHWAGYIQKQNISFISAPSFCENITISADPYKSPGVYSVLEIKTNQLIFKSFSGNYCFLDIELEV